MSGFSHNGPHKTNGPRDSIVIIFFFLHLAPLSPPASHTSPKPRRRRHHKPAPHWKPRGFVGFPAAATACCTAQVAAGAGREERVGAEKWREREREEGRGTFCKIGAQIRSKYACDDLYINQVMASYIYAWNDGLTYNHTLINLPCQTSSLARMFALFLCN